MHNKGHEIIISDINKTQYNAIRIQFLANKQLCFHNDVFVSLQDTCT